MLRYLFVLALIWRMVRLWKAHVKSGKRHDVVLEQSVNQGKGNPNDSLSDSCILC